VTRAFAELMHRLGYHHYGAQGGDTGAVISPGLGRLNLLVGYALTLALDSGRSGRGT
jgi:hypothetical protein